MNVVTTLENAEFAQSYKHHEKIPRRFSLGVVSMVNGGLVTALGDRGSGLQLSGREPIPKEYNVSNVTRPGQSPV
jgi:hypothetical protein